MPITPYLVGGQLCESAHCLLNDYIQQSTITQPIVHKATTKNDTYCSQGYNRNDKFLGWALRKGDIYLECVAGTLMGKNLSKKPLLRKMERKKPDQDWHPTKEGSVNVLGRVGSAPQVRGR